jgi:hypothetical protein
MFLLIESLTFGYSSSALFKDAKIIWEHPLLSGIIIVKLVNTAIQCSITDV